MIPSTPATAEVRASEDLWRSAMAPEGILERWNCADGATVAVGTSIAVVRIEDALHELTAARSGRLQQFVAVDALVEPGTVIGSIGA